MAQVILCKDVRSSLMTTKTILRAISVSPKEDKIEQEMERLAPPLQTPRENEALDNGMVFENPFAVTRKSRFSRTTHEKKAHNI